MVAGEGRWAVEGILGRVLGRSDGWLITPVACQLRLLRRP